jgi:ABC-type amino acid transport substrate-binding protein
VLKGSVNYEGTNGIRELTGAFDVSCEFLEVDSYAAVFEAVKNGQADAGVTSKDHGYLHKADFSLVETPIIFQPSLLYFAFTRGTELTPELVERIDSHIRELKADPDSIYYTSLRRWFSLEVRRSRSSPPGC